MIKQTTFLAALSALALILTFLLQWIPVLILDVGSNTDVLFASLVFLFFFNGLISSNLIQVVVPVFSDSSDEIRYGGYWLLVLVITVVSLAFCICLFQCIPILVSLLFSTYTETMRADIAAMAGISVVALFFSILSYLFAAGLQIQDRFLRVEVINVLASIVALLLLPFLLKKFSTEGAVMALVIRWAVTAMMSALSIRNYSIDFTAVDDLKKVWSTYRYLLAGGLIFNLDTVVDKFLSARASAGDLSVLHLVELGFSAFNAITNKSVTALRMREMAIASATGDAIVYYSRLKLGMLIIMSLNVLLVSGLIICWFLPSVVLQVTLAGVALERWLLVSLLLVGIPVFGTLGGLFAASFYARRNTRTPTIVGLFGFLVGTLLKLICFRMFGFNGLLVAISMSMFLNVLVYWLMSTQDKFVSS